MVLRVDLIADIYLTSSIPMVPFRTTWKLHMSFIEKSCNCFLSKRNFFFSFIFYELLYILHDLFFHFQEYFYSFMVTRDSIFYYWKIFFYFILLRSFLSFKISSSKSSRALVNFITCASYICMTSFELLLLYIFNSQKNPQAFPLYFKKKALPIM